MLRIRPTKQTLIALAVVAVLILGACGFMYYNFGCKIGTLNAEIDKKQQKLDNSEETTRRLARVELEYTGAQAKLGSLEKGVSTKAYLPTLLRQIEDMGRGVNMRVVGVRPMVTAAPPPPPPTTSADGKTTKVARKAPDPYDKLDIDIEVVGKYSDVTHFLYMITSFPKIIAVNSVQMSLASGDARNQPGSPLLSVKLGTTAFILKESSQPAKTGDQKTAKAEAVASSGGV